MNIEQRPLVTIAAAAAHNAYRHLRIAQLGIDPSHNNIDVFVNLEREQREACYAGVLSILNDDCTDEQSHDAWVRHMIATGWRYGVVKSVADKIHPGLVEYDKLDYQLKALNEVFCGTVRLIRKGFLSIPNQ